ncbi:hypothetical protein PMIN01_00645 [Paraphaeosphaeria minitans]|uniref:Uncharacterized protein n=1 Tax=Paraphaeosphaeria minitans TaxID=565426 RepID=A0A9P6GTH9_9PLEO|nr:hypothetical protein PMIN01_00645 [Paraphaeosphaeria minitans]
MRPHGFRALVQCLPKVAAMHIKKWCTLSIASCASEGPFVGEYQACISVYGQGSEICGGIAQRIAERIAKTISLENFGAFGGELEARVCVPGLGD